MYLEAKETARLYKLLSDKLGSDTTEAMFKYIDNKTERSVEATIKTLATKDDIAKVKYDLSKEIGNSVKMDVYLLDRSGWCNIGDHLIISEEIRSVNKQIKTLATKEDTISIKEEFAGLREDIGNYKNDLIKLMFLLSVAYVEIFFAVVQLVR